MAKFDNTTARDLRSIIQNFIIREQRSGVTLAQISMPPMPEYPDIYTIREAIEKARQIAEPAVDVKAEDKEAEKEEKISFFEALSAVFAERRQAKQERRTMRVYYKYACQTTELQNNIKRRVSLERIAAYEEVLGYVENMYIDSSDCAYDIAGGTVSIPIPMHEE